MQRIRRETTELPAGQLQLTKCRNEIRTHLDEIVFLHVISVILLIILMVMSAGCVPQGADRLWLQHQQHHWTYKWTPLTVQWDRELFEYQNKSIDLALDMFPCDMLKEYEDGDPGPNIKIEVIGGTDSDQRYCGNGPIVEDRYSGTDNPDGPAQATAKHCEGWCEIYLRGDTLGLDPALVYVVAAHELGHCVGLTHDGRMGGYYQSIMYPDVAGVVKAFEDGKPMPDLTAQDEAALEARYCPR